MKKRTLLLALCAPTMTLVAKDRPNIIFIMTDQQTATAMSNCGNDDLSTPNLDRLASMGVRFDNSYCTSPLSGPSRSAMFTGLTPSQSGLKANGNPMPEQLKPQSLGVMLSEQGYDCAYAGKWHVHTGTIPDGEFGFELIHPHENYDELASSVADYLKRDHSDPFFVVASYINPHNICQFARGDELPDIKIDMPALEYCPGLPINYAVQPYDATVIREERLKSMVIYPTVNYNDDDWRRYRYAYNRMVEQIDAQIGEIITAIEDEGLLKNSIIIFTSDHGDGVGAHNWSQKSALYEEVVNVPMIVVAPKMKSRGMALPQLIGGGLDIYASICDWAELELPTHCNGVSFRSLVERPNTETPHQEYIVTETLFDRSTTAGWMVRTPRYKYVKYDKGDYAEQLFDMKNDRGETQNLVIEARYSEILDSCRKMLLEWESKSGNIVE